MNIIECPGCHSRYDAFLTNPGDQFHCQCGQQFFIPDLPKQAKAWNCPSCAGAVSPDHQRCNYCGVNLSFARCPSCFSLAKIKDAKYCSECGKSLKMPAKALQNIDDVYPCPRCDRSTLTSQSPMDILIHGCEQCGGVWINHKSLRRVLKTANEPSMTGALGKVSKNAGELPYHEVSYLPCPECQQLMHRRNFAFNSNIIIDECEGHGVWFDHKELGAAIEHLRSKFTAHENESKPGSKSQTSSSADKVFNISEEDINLLLKEYPEYFSKSPK